jgi:hypothetical protein
MLINKDPNDYWNKTALRFLRCGNKKTTIFDNLI